MKKSQLVRELIAAAKAAGQSQESIIGSVMALDMQRQLARAYIKNNWSKVEAPQAQEQQQEAADQERAAETVAEVVELTPEQKLAIKRERDAKAKRDKRAAAKANKEAA